MAAWAESGDGTVLRPRHLICEACGEAARGDATGWRAYIGLDDGIAIFCAVCAEREFGEDETVPLENGPVHDRHCGRSASPQWLVRTHRSDRGGRRVCRARLMSGVGEQAALPGPRFEACEDVGRVAQAGHGFRPGLTRRGVPKGFARPRRTRGCPRAAVRVRAALQRASCPGGSTTRTAPRPLRIRAPSVVTAAPGPTSVKAGTPPRLAALATPPTGPECDRSRPGPRTWRQCCPARMRPSGVASSTTPTRLPRGRGEPDPAYSRAEGPYRGRRALHTGPPVDLCGAAR